jgi:hypothetical protein
VRVAPEAAEEVVHLLVQHRVVGDAAFEILQLRGGRQFAVEQQVADLEEMRFLGQLVDRVAAMQKLALVAVDEGDRAFAGRGRGEARIVGEHAALRIELADVDHVGAGGGRIHRQLVALAVDGQRGGSWGLSHGRPFSNWRAGVSAGRRG